MSRDVIGSITSESTRCKADIVRRPEGGFQVFVSRWTEEWVEGYGKVYEGWVMVNRGVTFTDTMERAEERARELLEVYDE